MSAKKSIYLYELNKILASILCAGVIQQLRLNQAMVGNRHPLMIRCG